MLRWDYQLMPDLMVLSEILRVKNKNTDTRHPNWVCSAFFFCFSGNTNSTCSTLLLYCVLLQSFSLFLMVPSFFLFWMTGIKRQRLSIKNRNVLNGNTYIPWINTRHLFSFTLRNTNSESVFCFVFFFEISGGCEFFRL